MIPEEVDVFLKEHHDIRFRSFEKILEYISMYGKDAYAKLLEYQKASDLEKQKARNKEYSKKGGKYYERMLINQRTGISGAKHQIRAEHGRFYRQYKKIIDPYNLSQLHHEWIPGTPDYRGIALVEADHHMGGFIDVIKVLRGKITLCTEKEVREVYKLQ